MGLIPEQTIEQIRRSVDIVEVISEVVPLKRAGRSFKALCPFHEEKTPSFNVSPDRQTYHCFGCQRGGNVFTFLMEYDRLSFPEAVRDLGRRVGIEVRQGGGRSGPSRSKLEKDLEILEMAARFFQAKLKEASGPKQYLADRRIEPASIERFRLGFSPGGNALTNHLRREGVDLQDMIRLGLGYSGHRGVRDKFSGRLIFPIRDVRGRVIAFGGRILGEGHPKYLNSPEGPLFKKSRVLYGLCLAKEATRKERQLGLVEGYTDVIMAHQEGFPHFVAPLGTALTEEHGRLLSRYADEVTVLFDGDEAGAKAARRACAVLLESGSLEARFVTLEEGDPYDVLVERGREAFEAALEKSRDVFQFAFEDPVRGTESGSREQVEVVDRFLKLVDAIPNVVQQNLLLGRAASAIRIPEEDLRVRFRNLKDGWKKRQRGPKQPQSPKSRGKRSLSRRHKIEREICAICVRVPDLVTRVTDRISVDELEAESAQRIIGRLVEARPGDANEVVGLFRDRKRSAFVARVLSSTGPERPGEVLDSFLDALKLEELTERIQKLKTELERVAGEGDREEQDRVLLQKLELEREQRTIKERLGRVPGWAV